MTFLIIHLILNDTKMATIKLTNKQLRLIQRSLDFYSRVGCLQFDEILSHPTINNAMNSQFTPDKELEVGDETMRGKIVEIGKGFIKTKGTWGKGEEIKTWTDVDKIKLSPNWNELHDNTDEIRLKLNSLKRLITGENWGSGGHLGIYNGKTDDSCREAYDILQVIRNEFWKEEPNRSSITVDSSISLSSKEPIVEVKLDNIQDVRKRKLNSIKNDIL